MTSLAVADAECDLRKTQKKAMARHSTKVAKMATITIRAMIGSEYLSSSSELSVVTVLSPSVLLSVPAETYQENVIFRNCNGYEGIDD